MLQQCEYCKSKYPKSDFRVKGDRNKSSIYCSACRDTAETKDKEKSLGNFARELTPYEIELQENFLLKKGLR